MPQIVAFTPQFSGQDPAKPLSSGLVRLSLLSRVERDDSVTRIVLVNENHFHYQEAALAEVRSQMFEKLLGTLLGETDDSRVELVQVAEPGETPTLEVRLLRDAGELGWRVHKRIRLAAGQIGELRDALNLMDIDGRDARKPADRSADHLRLVDFDEAL
jgi:hypothetical protein